MKLRTVTLEMLGVKLALVIAGFAGGVVSLRYVQGLNWWRGVLCVLSGCAVANYITPIFMHFTGIPEAYEVGSGFIVGLIGLNLTAGIFKRSVLWRDDPTLPSDQRRGEGRW